MATGADIPPELILQILFDACKNARVLLDPYRYKTVPNRKQAIKNVTACSLTCVYWARICRQELFQYISIKNFEDMRAFLGLVANTPKTFVPISKYIWHATLVQRVDEKPWLHLIWMQHSLFRVWPLRDSVSTLYFYIEDSPNDLTRLQRSMSQRLFASLPRIPPPSCLACLYLTIGKPRFVNPRDLTILLQKFSPNGKVRLTNVTWSEQTQFEDDLLIRGSLTVPYRISRAEVRSSEHTAETAWLAFAAIVRCHARQEYTSSSSSGKPSLQVLPSAQRTILNICKSFCKGRTVSSLELEHFTLEDERLLATSSTMDTSKWSWPMNVLLEDTSARNHYFVCRVQIDEHELASDCTLGDTKLAFYGAQVAIPASDGSNSVVVDYISVLCVYMGRYSTTDCSSSGLPNHMTYHWAEIVGLCAAQTGFIRLQLLFNSHDDLVQFMEAQRATLNKLDGRVALFYAGGSSALCAADFETLADLDGLGNGYVRFWPYNVPE